MQILESIREKLVRFPMIQFESDEDAMTVNPASYDGFTVTFYQCEQEYVISLGGWHEQFDDASEALDIFFRSLSNHARLDVRLSGDTEYQWTLETLENGLWQPHSTCGLLFFPFWRRRAAKIQQNDILPFQEHPVS